MELHKIRMDGIPSILWGGPSNRIIIAAHGSHSSKIDDCIWVLAEEATAKGYQVLSFDLPLAATCTLLKSIPTLAW